MIDLFILVLVVVLLFALSLVHKFQKKRQKAAKVVKVIDFLPGDSDLNDDYLKGIQDFYQATLVALGPDREWTEVETHTSSSVAQMSNVIYHDLAGRHARARGT